MRARTFRFFIMLGLICFENSIAQTDPFRDKSEDTEAFIEFLRNDKASAQPEQPQDWLEYVRDPKRTPEQKLGGFLAFPGPIPPADYLAALGDDREAVLAMARKLSKAQLEIFRRWKGFKRRTDREENDSESTRALKSLLYAGDVETLREIADLWNNYPILATSTNFGNLLGSSAQPKLALILAPALELGVGLLDVDDDGKLASLLKDPEKELRYDRAKRAAILICRIIRSNYRVPEAAKTWFKEQVQLSVEYRANYPDRDQNLETYRRYWRRSRSWVLTNKAALEEGRFADLSVPNSDRSFPISSAQSNGSIRSATNAASPANRKDTPQERKNQIPRYALLSVLFITIIGCLWWIQNARKKLPRGGGEA